MAKLRRLGYKLRLLLGEAGFSLLTAAAAALVGAGWFPDLRRGHPPPLPVAMALTLGALVVARLALRLSSPPGKQDGSTTRADIELGAALLVSSYVVLELTGSLRSPVYPLIYAMVAFVVTFHRALLGLCLVVIALGLELLLYRSSAAIDPRAAELAVSHVAFIGFFGLIHFLFLQGEVLRQRHQHRLGIEREVRQLRDEARDFRLISSSLSADPRTRSRAADEERMAIGAVETIHETLFYTLELLKRSLELHTCLLLWLEEGGERLRIKELVTDSEFVSETPLPASAGALGTVVKNRVLVNLSDPKPGHLPYYSGPEEIGCFVGLPVMEDGHLRGVLCADRSARRLFTPADEMLLQGAAEQMLRAIQSERVFAAVERAKYEHERFFAALAHLNRALTAEQVYQTTFEAARDICDFDFAAFSLFDRLRRKHTVVSACGDTPKGLAGLEFRDNAGLAAMVVKNKHYLPAGGELRDKEAPLYNHKVRLEGMESLLVLPLICAEEAIGAFTIASRRPRAFGKHKREMLQVIASHVAVKLEGAQMYGRMEQMATTDGLTGLVNHRAFQERMLEMLARAERAQTRQALLLTDIDHFKKVNDSYGHPLGDQVLRGVAQVVSGCVRKIDLAARYGGEEFAIVLEGTDLDGALQLGERIRGEVHKQVFQSERGPLSVTLSLGIAVYPEDGRDAPTLIKHADEALYRAKRSGRNRAVAFGRIPEAAELSAS